MWLSVKSATRHAPFRTRARCRIKRSRAPVQLSKGTIDNHIHAYPGLSASRPGHDRRGHRRGQGAQTRGRFQKTTGASDIAPNRKIGRRIQPSPLGCRPSHASAWDDEIRPRSQLGVSLPPDPVQARGVAPQYFLPLLIRHALEAAVDGFSCPRPRGGGQGQIC